ncbi:M26 family metallopeptidase, partial [Enterococcus faecalis]|uniref:hypothetical protein n=1 Tax=Enterococcus faecalis TaxID=1351 RepID=UPI00115C1A54
MIGETRGEVIFLSPYNYQNDFDIAEQVLRKAMKTITNTLELYDRTIDDKELINVDKVLGQRTVLDQGRNWLDPEDSLSYDLYRVAGYDGSHPNNGAVAGAGQIQMQADKLDADYTVAHELGHELNNLFNADSEFYTTYISNVGRQSAAYVNTYGDGQHVQGASDAIANESTLQMQSKEDLVTYATNMEDMAYVLDGIIATKVLELPLEEQAKYIKIANVDGESGTVFTEAPNSDEVQVRDLTVEELKQLNIKTIDDLIDSDAVIVQPNDTNKNILRNHGQGYGTTLTYSPFFLVNGKPFHHNHRIINTLLAEGGWEAFKEFNMSYNETMGQIKDPTLNVDEKVAIGSSAALKKVYNDENITYRELIRKRYAESMDNFKKNGLLGESYESVLKNLSSIELLNFYSYKSNMMARYLKLTNDFSTSAFEKNNENCYNVGSYTELYETIEKNPYAEINLTQDFDVEGKYSEKELPTFYGTLNGNGYTVSKATHPLFTIIQGAEVKNLILNEETILNTSDSRFGGLTGLAE